MAERSSLRSAASWGEGARSGRASARSSGSSRPERRCLRRRISVQALTVSR